MSRLDEITKEKQRVSEALARVDAQREKLAGPLEELEAAERVLARYSQGAQSRRTASAKTPTMATKAAAPAQSRGRTRISHSREVRRPSRREPRLNLGHQPHLYPLRAVASGRSRRATCRVGPSSKPDLHAAGDCPRPAVRRRLALLPSLDAYVEGLKETFDVRRRRCVSIGTDQQVALAVCNTTRKGAARRGGAARWLHTRKGGQDCRTQ